MNPGRILQLIGTFLPILGVAATAIVARFTSGWKRWVGLITIPALTLAVSMAFGDQIARDGNLLFVLLFALLFVALVVYYPVLAVIGLTRIVAGRRNRTEEAPDDGTARDSSPRSG